MKIAYCIDNITALGGIERITLSKANALADIENNRIYIIVAFHKGLPILPLNPRIELINLNVNYGEDFGKSALHSKLIMLQKRREHKKKLTKLVNSIQPDILISTNQSEKHFIKDLSLSYNPVIIREIHFCSDYRLIEAETIPNKIMARIGHYMDYHWKMKGIDKIVLLTEEDRIRNWGNNKKVTVIPNPVTQVSNLPPSTCTEKRVIAAGRLVRQKNFASLIHAWKIVADRHPDWRLDIYGEGGEKKMLEGLIAKLELSEHVFLKGKTNNLLHEMTNSSIFALSSIYEGYALVLIEAMSCGLPTVSYDCPCGPKDLIAEGKDGYLVTVNDERTLAQRICHLIENENLRKEMGSNAIEKAKEYQMDIIIRKWMKLFNSFKRSV